MSILEIKFTDMLFSFISYLENEKRASSHTVLAYKKDLEQFADFLKALLTWPILPEAGHH
jgi:integrase/recombinase XerC